MAIGSWSWLLNLTSWTARRALSWRKSRGPYHHWWAICQYFLINIVSVTDAPFSPDSLFRVGPAPEKLFFTRLPDSCMISLHLTVMQVVCVRSLYRRNDFIFLPFALLQLMNFCLYIVSECWIPVCRFAQNRSKRNTVGYHSFTAALLWSRQWLERTWRGVAWVQHSPARRGHSLPEKQVFLFLIR